MGNNLFSPREIFFVNNHDLLLSTFILSKSCVGWGMCMLRLKQKSTSMQLSAYGRSRRLSLHYSGSIQMFGIKQIPIFFTWASVVAQRVKSLPAMQETLVWSLCWENPLKEEMAIHCSILAWKIPWAEEPGKLQSMGSQRVRHNWVTFTIFFT